MPYGRNYSQALIKMHKEKHKVIREYDMTEVKLKKMHQIAFRKMNHKLFVIEEKLKRKYPNATIYP